MKILIVVLATLVVGALCEEKCIPGTTFMEDCNKCRCSTDGLKACTRKMCPPTELSDDAQVRTEQVQNGDALSSADEKDEVHLQTNGQVCTPNEIKMQDCNRCRCANNGIGWFCTKRQCPQQRDKRSVYTQKCTPGSTFMADDGCNTCHCADDGRAACTRRACAPKDDSDLIRFRRQAPKCTRRGESYKKDCNQCTCSEDGLEACTFMLCLPENRQKRQAADQLPQSAIAPGSPGFSCVPRSTFKYQCNTCTCLDNGLNAGCTLKFCLPGEW